MKYGRPRRSSRTMNGSKRLGCCTQEDPPYVVVDLVVGPVRVQCALVRLAQPPGRPVKTIGLPQPLARSHRAVPCNLLGRWPIHDSMVAREAPPNMPQDRAGVAMNEPGAWLVAMRGFAASAAPEVCRRVVRAIAVPGSVVNGRRGGVTAACDHAWRSLRSAYGRSTPNAGGAGAEPGRVELPDTMAPARRVES